MSAAEQNRRLVWKGATAKSTPKPLDTIGRIYIPDRVLGWIIPVTVLLVWELLARLGMLPPNWLPAPTVVGKTIYQLAVTGDLVRHAGTTIARVAVGFVLGASAGTLLGGLTGYLPVARKLLDPSLQALRSVPSVSYTHLDVYKRQFQSFRQKIGEFPQNCIKQDADHHDVGLHELARVHRHVADARAR